MADWAKLFVGYAYANGLTAGTSATTYGGDEFVSVAQYLTFVLKVLEYEAGKDFQRDKSWELSMTSGEYNTDTTSFTRGDVAVISLSTHQAQEMLATAPYWGLPADIRWIANPETMEDLDNNILSSFLFGNYSLNFARHPFMDQGISVLRERMNTLSTTYSALMGPYGIVRPRCGITEEIVLLIEFPRSVCLWKPSMLNRWRRWKSRNLCTDPVRSELA